MSTSRGHILFLMTTYFAIAHLDRQIINITLEAIGKEFLLNDTQLGLLSGFAFAIFFSLMTLPFALLANRVSHQKLIASTIGFWSLMTLASGFAQNFSHLILTRIGIGVGEAGVLPVSHAIIARLYQPRERTGALAIFFSGAHVGVATALIVGGLITQYYGWRVAVQTAAVPGLILAVVIMLTFKIQPSRRSDTDGSHNLKLVKDTAGTIWRKPELRFMTIGAVLSAITTFGIAAWLPTFLIRAHGMALPSIGLYAAVSIGFFGAAGAIIAGKIADRLSLRNLAWLAWIPAICLLFAKPFAVYGFIVDHKFVALALMLLPAFFSGTYMASTITVLHENLSEKARPIASAIILMLVNLIGMSVGPLFVGLVSDLWNDPQNGLSAGLIFLQVFGMAGILAFFLAGKRLVILSSDL
ncbi:MFS transporter [Alphaproteobacteria bacterium]|nr:MFS transporter [Alphaproteobacteria bacterium]